MITITCRMAAWPHGCSRADRREKHKQSGTGQVLLGPRPRALHTGPGAGVGQLHVYNDLSIMYCLCCMAMQHCTALAHAMEDAEQRVEPVRHGVRRARTLS